MNASTNKPVQAWQSQFASDLGKLPHVQGDMSRVDMPQQITDRWQYVGQEGRRLFLLKHFVRSRCHENLVLMGDAAASAHFSIGSGTKLALESAIALAQYLHSEPDMAAAFEKYEDARRLEVLRLQSAARNSLEWFEDIERYFDLDPVQFNYSLLTRSQRISHENLRLRDPQ